MSPRNFTLFTVLVLAISSSSFQAQAANGSHDQGFEFSSPFEIALETLQKQMGQVGYNFSSVALLRRAMTHASFSEENNRALSILGENVIRTAVAFSYLRKDIEISPKDLNRRISEISKVESSCTVDGKRLGLQKVIRVSPKTDSTAPVVVCGAFRAIFGAIAIDTGKPDNAGRLFLSVHGGDVGKALPLLNICLDGHAYAVSRAALFLADLKAPLRFYQIATSLGVESVDSPTDNGSNPFFDEAAMAHQRDLEPIEETSSNSLLRNTRCGCFPCFNHRRQSSSTVGLAWWERIRTVHQIQPPHSQRWWTPAVTAFLRVREWSEIVAGPKWKTFIRRFNRNRSGNSNHNQGKYQYDPLSYSLNFDESGDLDQDKDFGGYRNFSSRYASTKPAAAAEDRRQEVAALA
ncbi:hypothetical protein EZV62_022832 [Acer yangbiense]|uniref:RNase III domain-containing protein n=1 Tax=Acer yangbiense TaxID=1000413 RepID=A0A5C7GZU0_9ROSI|nr:hypothetical protein EZV62_022832 [Acer yangbiense]